VIEEASPKLLGTVGTNGATIPIHERTEFILPFSAADFPTLKNNIARHREVSEGYDLSDLAFTLSSRRSFFYNRGYAIVSKDSVFEDLEDSQMTLGKRGNGAKIGFIFTGRSFLM
jgi:hypothetical protein